MTEQALTGLRVVDYSRGVMGAVCAKALADFGADVVKVEPPDGDATRRRGPFANDTPDPEQSGSFLYLNANKRGVTLDPSSASDRRLLEGLIAGADAFVTDLSPREATRLEVDYTNVKRLNERVIGTYVTYFGQTGAYRDFKGADLLAWHMGGLGYEMPAFYVTDHEREYPLRGGADHAEFLAGWTAATATMVALSYRETYGEGQIVDVSAMDAIANHVRTNFAIYSYDISRVPESRAKTSFPWIWPCKDGHVSIAFTLDHWWESLKETMGRPAWAENPDWADFAGRRNDMDAIEPNVIAWMSEYTRMELYTLLQSSGVPCFVVQSMEEVVKGRHFTERGFFVQQEHPKAGSVTQPGPLIRMSRTPWQLDRPAPTLGEHNAELLNESPLWQPPAPEDGPPAPLRTAGDDNRNRPLQGMRVLDFGWILSAPHCGTWLGSLGAEVIRVESNARLELGRRGMMASADGIGGTPNRSAQWNGINFSKLDVTLNLAQQQARELVKELVAVSDVILENFATGVMKRLGLDYESLRRIKPDIVMISGSTLGVTGPESAASGWGPNVCSYAGLPYVSGYPGGPPVNMGGNWPDYLVGTMMAFSVLSAIRHRQRAGEGQYIEISMAEVVAGGLFESYLDYTMNGRQRERVGNRDRMMAPHGVYRCRGFDQWVAVAVANDEEWQAMCRVAVRAGWAADRRFATLADRKRNEDDLEALVGEWTKTLEPREAMRLLQDAGVAAGPVMGVLDLMDDPHLRERGLVIELDHPEVGPRTVAGLPVRFGAMPKLPYSPSPTLGQHNGRIFGELLGIDRKRLDTLVEAKVVH